MSNKDVFGNIIYNDLDIIKFLYQGRTDLNAILSELETPDVKKFNEESENKIKIYKPITYSISEFDSILQNDWFMPDEYTKLDICTWIKNQCPVENLPRVEQELAIFQERNLLHLLRWLKYFVDQCRIHNILWGVGRGSSVSSYVLFLIGVHKVDSIKYNLDYHEFLR